MPKTFTLDGKRKRLNPLVPTGQISRIVADIHIGAPDGEVVEIIAKRAKQNTGWNARLIGNAATYALHCHRKNQALYRAVMLG